MTTVRFAMAFAAVALLGACAGKPLAVANTVLNFGNEHVDEDMRNKHLVGIVAFDETHPSQLGRVARNHLYLQGVAEGTPEYGYRVVRINGRWHKGAGWIGDGEWVLHTGAVVPDHLPALKAWDIVEYRNLDLVRNITDFSRTGEGNVVVGILCHADRPDYKECSARMPKIGKWIAGFGPTPYPASVKHYGFTFTPAYDAAGNALRPLPPRSGS
jgi:hypothetical protein